MLVISNVIAVAAIVTAAVAGCAAGLAIGWIAGGGRCGLGLHAWRPIVRGMVAIPGEVYEECVRCSTRRTRHYLGAD